MLYSWIEYYSHRRSCFAAFISAKPFMLIVFSSWRLNKRSRLVYSSSKTAFFHVNITWLQPLQTLCNRPCEEIACSSNFVYSCCSTFRTPEVLLVNYWCQLKFVWMKGSPDEFQIAIFICLELFFYLRVSFHM